VAYPLLIEKPNDESFKSRLGLWKLGFHDHKVDNESECKGYEPGISIQGVEQIGLCDLPAWRGGCSQEAGHNGSDGEYERDDCPPIHAIRIGIDSISFK
jgi:hypothetical protein